MQVLLTVFVLAIAILAWVCLVTIIPWCNVSRFRYRLWRLRDELSDDIRWGKFEDDAQPRMLVALIEGTISIAAEATVAKMALVLWSCRGLRSLKTPSGVFDLDAAQPTDKALLEERVNDLKMAMARHVLFGAPSGWLFTCLLVPVAVVVAVGERLRSRDGGHRGSLREDVELRVASDVKPAIELLGQRSLRATPSLSHSF